MFASLKRLPLGLGLVLCCLAPAQAQQYQFNKADGQEQKSSDPRNRARIHTELGAMYFQAGNYAVALDELQIALNADSATTRRTACAAWCVPR